MLAKGWLHRLIWINIMTSSVKSMRSWRRWVLVVVVLVVVVVVVVVKVVTSITPSFSSLPFEFHFPIINHQTPNQYLI